MKQRKKVVNDYFLYCPKCNKEITGKSPKQVDYNLKQHLEGKECMPKNQN